MLQPLRPKICDQESLLWAAAQQNAFSLGGSPPEGVEITELVLLLAGFTLAHAAWSASDLPRDELLTPMMIVVVNEQRTLTRYEAQTQTEAIAQGRKAAERESALGHAWAFAHDGTIRTGHGVVDVLVVEFWEPGMPAPVQLVQQYEPYHRRQQFHVLGQMDFRVGDSVLVEKAASGARAIVLEGVASHQRAGPSWNTWQAPAP